MIYIAGNAIEAPSLLSHQSHLRVGMEWCIDRCRSSHSILDLRDTHWLGCVKYGDCRVIKTGSVQIHRRKLDRNQHRHNRLVPGSRLEPNYLNRPICWINWRNRVEAKRRYDPYYGCPKMLGDCSGHGMLSVSKYSRTQKSQPQTFPLPKNQNIPIKSPLTFSFHPPP